MLGASALATPSRLDEAADSLWAELGQEPDIVFAFVSATYADYYGALPQRLRARFPTVLRFGCCAGDVVGNQEEVEAGIGSIKLHFRNPWSRARLSQRSASCVRSHSQLLRARMSRRKLVHAQGRRSSPPFCRQHYLSVLRRACIAWRAGCQVVVAVDTKVVQDSLACFGGWDDGDDLHVAAALVALEDVDGEYAPEEFCSW